MFKTLLVAISVLLYFNSGVALGTNTAEKWQCVRAGQVWSVRLAAAAKGQAPCKVFYAKHRAGDTNDVLLFADEDAGKVEPKQSSVDNGASCVRFLASFIDNQQDHTWACIKP